MPWQNRLRGLTPFCFLNGINSRGRPDGETGAEKEIAVSVQLMWWY